MTAERLAQIAALLDRIERSNMMGAGDAWQLKTACRDLLAERERLAEQVRRLTPVQALLPLEAVA